jgi:asparagine synthase (glutamine-hydrolysing)
MDIDHLIYTQDEPFGSLSIYAQYCVMKLAHGKVKVLLDGQGADELFGGYLAYQKNYISELIKKNYWLLALKEMLGSFRHHKYFYRYAIYQTLVRNKRKNLLTNYIKTHRYEGKFNTMLHNELFTTNLPSLLHFEDRNSMAFSIEARVPYLDTEFTNYIASLPYDQKIRNGVTKFALRNAIKGVIPERIRMRMDKMGFVTPEESWMKYELKDYIIDILYSTSFKNRGYWNSDKVIEDYQKFTEGKTNYSPEIWRIICTELWLRKFFDNRSTLFSGIL